MKFICDYFVSRLIYEWFEDSVYCVDRFFRFLLMNDFCFVLRGLCTRVKYPGRGVPDVFPKNSWVWDDVVNKIAPF